MTHHTMTAREWALLLLLSLVWGGSFFVNEIAVAALPVLTVVWARVVLAAVVLWTVVLIRGGRVPRQARIWRAFFAMGLLNNAVPFSLIVYGQTQVASGVASILNAATPLFTVLFAHLLTRDERLTPNRLAGVLVGFAGVAMMFGGLGTLGGDTHLAQLACLGGAVSYALAGLYGRRFRALGVSPLTTAAGQVTASGLLLAPLVLAFDHPWTLAAPALQVWMALAGVAVLSTALAYVMYFWLLASAGATNLLLVTFLIPVSAILLGTLFLNEDLSPRQVAGMALIGLGLAAIDGRLWRRVIRRRS